MQSQSGCKESASFSQQSFREAIMEKWLAYFIKFIEMAKFIEKTALKKLWFQQKMKYKKIRNKIISHFSFYQKFITDNRWLVTWSPFLELANFFLIAKITL